jgi:uncharacterized membrane protein YfcA
VISRSGVIDHSGSRSGFLLDGGYYHRMGSLEIIVLCGALIGGFVSGLTGFGTGLAALPLWLIAIPPVLAAPLVVICSIVGQLQTLPSIWKSIKWSQVAPFIAGGLAGVPFGTLLLAVVPMSDFRLFIGCLLIIYCSFMLARKSMPKFSLGGKIADSIIGVVSGVLGGFAGLSGVLPTVWAGLRGWDKQQKRGLFQAFNLSILTLALLSQAIGGFVTAELARLLFFALPGTLIGVWSGHKMYRRLGERRFDQLVLILLLLSGFSILVSSFI